MSVGSLFSLFISLLFLGDDFFFFFCYLAYWSAFIFWCSQIAPLRFYCIFVRESHYYHGIFDRSTRTLAQHSCIRPSFSLLFLCSFICAKPGTFAGIQFEVRVDFRLLYDSIFCFMTLLYTLLPLKLFFISTLSASVQIFWDF